MTREAILEYARAVSPRYLAASKREKGVILDEFCKTTGHHRKAAVRLLRQPPPAGRQGLGRPRQYGLAVVEALRQVWEVSDRLCSKRLAPFMGELVGVLERQGEMALAPEVRQQLLGLSAATIDRLLKPYRRQGGRRPYSQRRSATGLKALIPVRTFGDWTGVKPGSMQLDLVAHCGESTANLYLNTLVAVDVASSWSEYEVIWGKGQQRVGTGVHKIRQRLPFRLHEIHTDNGGEFINDMLYPWCKREGIKFTRGRAYKKNDQAYVEQKNWSVPRRLIGYDRYSTRGAMAQMQRLYELVRLYVNFFQPVRKLLRKEREGAKVRKYYDVAQTPFRRLLANNTLDEGQRQALLAQYGSLNPVKLRAEIEEALEALWELADRGRVNGLVQAVGKEPVVCG